LTTVRLAEGAADIACLKLHLLLQGGKLLLAECIPLLLKALDNDMEATGLQGIFPTAVACQLPGWLTHITA
jgi:hypothetical protein